MVLPLLLSASWPCLQSHQKRGLKVLASSNFVSDFHWPADHLLEVQCVYGLKKALYLSVNVFSTKLLIGDTIWRRDRHFTWSSEPRKGLTACCAKGVQSTLS